MALATTCPQCKTSFKVVPDQLKLRRGMVRCGMCQHVFSGIDFLRYVDEGARKAAGSGSTRGPATVTERPERDPAPVDQGHTDLKTAFFLPETVFQPTAVAPPPPPPAAPPLPAAGTRVQVPESLQARPARSHASGLASTPGGIIVQTGAVAGAAAPERELAAPERQLIAPDVAGGPASEMRPPDDGIVAPPTIPANEAATGPDAPPATSFPMPVEPEPVVDAEDGRNTGTGTVTAYASGSTAEPGRALGPDEAEDLAPLPSASPAASASPATPPPRNRRATDRIRVAPPPEPAADEWPVADDRPAAHDGPGAHDRLAADDEQAAPEDTLTVSTQRDVDAVRASFESERRSRWFRRDSEEADAIDYFGDERRVRGFSGRAAPLMWVAYGVLSLLLALQLLMGSAPRLFELYPNMARPFATLLSPWRTRAEMPRNLKALSIESFELAASPTPGVLLLSAVLRNDAASGVRWPAMELSLTDGGGALLVRKVILPDDYLKAVYADRPGAARDGLRANAELPLRLALEARDLTPAGYSVTLFYP